MKTLVESIAVAMDAQQDTAVIPFLPYIFQDFWELGTPPEIVINLVQRNCKNFTNLNILDLGCGKGATSVKLAAALKCNCYGIDAIPDFIEAAKTKAYEYGVDTICQFEIGDVRKRNGRFYYGFEESANEVNQTTCQSDKKTERNNFNHLSAEQAGSLFPIQEN